MKPNEGEVPQYYVTGSHPAIIEPDEWEQVQAEIARRKALGKAYSGKSVLSAKLVCKDCGAFFGPKVWHSTDQYRRTIWQCNGKFANEERCHTPVVDTETIQRLFIKAYNLMMQDRVQIMKQCEVWRARLMDFGTLDADIERQLEETHNIFDTELSVRYKIQYTDFEKDNNSQFLLLVRYRTFCRKCSGGIYGQTAEKTRDAIFQVFTALLAEKHYNQISVQEIIDRANVGRTTFYAHFETKDYLLKDLCEELFGHIVDTAMGLPHGHYHYSCGSETDSVFLHLLRHLQENDSNILELLASQNNEIFLRYFKSNLKELILRQYADKGLLPNSVLPEDYLVNHISSSFVETVDWWLSRKVKETPEECQVVVKQ